MTGTAVLRSGTLGRALARRTDRFAADSQGMALVEFAFMFPILVMLLFMVISLSHMMMIDRKVTIASQAAADLIAQRQDVNLNFAQDMNRAIQLMLQPFAAGPTDYNVSVAHIPFDSSTGAPELQSAEGWRVVIYGAAEISNSDGNTAASGGHVDDGGSIVAPPGAAIGPLGTPGDALIMLRMTYNYRSLWREDFEFFGLRIPGSLTFNKTAFARPRLIEQIELVEMDPSNPPTRKIVIN